MVVGSDMVASMYLRQVLPIISFVAATSFSLRKFDRLLVGLLGMERIDPVCCPFPFGVKISGKVAVDAVIAGSTQSYSCS